MCQGSAPLPRVYQGSTYTRKLLGVTHGGCLWCTAGAPAWRAGTVLWPCTVPMLGKVRGAVNPMASSLAALRVCPTAFPGDGVRTWRLPSGLARALHGLLCLSGAPRTDLRAFPSLGVPRVHLDTSGVRPRLRVYQGSVYARDFLRRSICREVFS